MEKSRKYNLILASSYGLKKLPIPESDCPLGQECNKITCMWASTDYQKCLHTEGDLSIHEISKVKDLNLKDVKLDIKEANDRVLEVAEFHKTMETLYLTPVVKCDLSYIVPTLNTLTRLFLVGKDTHLVCRLFFLNKKMKPWKVIGLKKSKFNTIKRKLEKNYVRS